MARPGLEGRPCPQGSQTQEPAGRRAHRLLDPGTRRGLCPQAPRPRNPPGAVPQAPRPREAEER